MLTVTFIILRTLFGSFSDLITPELEQIRANFSRGVADKAICRQMIAELSKSNTPVHKAYHGAYQAMWANHTINPITKLNTFSKGKRNIDAAVKAEPANAEIRFVRLSVQKNCPEFLGYRKNIAEDTRFILANPQQITSGKLKKMIADIVKAP